MDEFLDALQKSSRGRPGFPCSVKSLLLSMPDNHRAAVQLELDDIVRSRETGSIARHSCESLARVLTDNGHPIRGAVIQHHVAGRCTCGR
jgi:hypothetical protein